MTATFPVFAKQNAGVARKGNSTTEDAPCIFGVLIHDVAGSSPAGGARKKDFTKVKSFFQ